MNIKQIKLSFNCLDYRAEFDSAKTNLFSFDQSKEEESVFRTFSVVPLQSNMNLLKL